MMTVIKAIKVLVAFIVVYFLVFNATVAMFLFFQFIWGNIKDSFALYALALGSSITTFRITKDLFKSDCI